jgi:hypothetical protein
MRAAPNQRKGTLITASHMEEASRMGPADMPCRPINHEGPDFLTAQLQQMTWAGGK